MKSEIYEEYPWKTVLIVLILTLLVWLSGVFIMFKLNLITGILYLVYLLFLEFSIYKSCRYCCYYGKRCAFLRGKIAPLLVKKGNPKKFGEREFSWKDFAPQLLVIVIPVLIGILLLIQNFSLLLLLAVIYPVFNWFVINPVLYGKLTCPHCKQGKICCPAIKFFSKK